MTTDGANPARTPQNVRPSPPPPPPPKKMANKAFKSDSQRLAFSVLIVGFCVYGGMVESRVSVAHTLMRRYTKRRKLEFRFLGLAEK